MGMMTQLLAYTGEDFLTDLRFVLFMIFSVVGVLLILYAVYICYLFATASDEGKRKNAKSRLIKVISSCFIIFALLLCLKVIEVHFDTIEVNNTEEGADVDWESINYAYDDIPVLSVGSQASSFTLDPGKIKIKYDDVIGWTSLSGAKITNFKFVGLAVDDVLATNRIYQQGKPPISVNSSSGTLTYSYLALEGSHPLRCYSLTESPSTMVVYGAATFNYAGASNCVVNILIDALNRSNIDIITYFIYIF